MYYENETGRLSGRQLAPKRREEERISLRTERGGGDRSTGEEREKARREGFTLPAGESETDRAEPERASLCSVGEFPSGNRVSLKKKTRVLRTRRSKIPTGISLHVFPPVYRGGTPRNLFPLVFVFWSGFHE